MDEQNMNNQVPVAEVPVQTTQPVSPVDTPASVSSTTVVYASFWVRLLASLIDGFLVSVVVGILGGIFGFGGTTESGGASVNLFTLLGIVYYVFMTSKYGATVGKKALGLRVQDEKTGANLTIGGAIMREFEY